MKITEIPKPLLDILTEDAGTEHRREGKVVSSLARILTAYEDLMSPAKELPRQLWIAIQGTGEPHMFVKEDAVLQWMVQHPNSRMWNVRLWDSVEMVLVPATSARIEQKNFTP